MENLPLNFFTFPFWWYTQGLDLLWQFNKRQMNLGLHQTGLLLFARHMREPLYGDYTRSGVALSFFLRIVLIIFKLILLALRAAFLLVLNLLFLITPPLALAMIIFQLTHAR